MQITRDAPFRPRLTNPLQRILLIYAISICLLHFRHSWQNRPDRVIRQRFQFAHPRLQGGVDAKALSSSVAPASARKMSGARGSDNRLTFSLAGILANSRRGRWPCATLPIRPPVRAFGRARPSTRGLARFCPHPRPSCGAPPPPPEENQCRSRCIFFSSISRCSGVKFCKGYSSVEFGVVAIKSVLNPSFS